MTLKQLVRVTLAMVLAGAGVSAQDLSVESQRVTQQATVSGGTAPISKGDRAVWAGRTVDATGGVSRDGRFISYMDWGTLRLMIRDVAASVDRVLAVSETDGQPSMSALSRDGNQVVYYMAATRAEVHIASVPASGLVEPRRLVVPNAVRFSGFDWSPDGKWIAAGVELADETGQIGLIAVADGSFRSVASVGRGVLARIGLPTRFFFSPDGKYLAYDRPPTGGSSQRDVFVLAIDGGRDLPAIAHGANDFVVGWWPDGSRLLFRSDRAGSWGLWAQSFAGGAAHGAPALLKSDIGPSVSLGVTDSGTLYLYRRTSARDVVTARIDLEAGKLLGPPVGFSQGFIDGAQNANWSPDGKSLAYPVTCDGGCLAIRSVATGQVRRLAPAMIVIRSSSWSPDSRSLLTEGVDTAGRSGIFRVDVQSGETTPVTHGDVRPVVGGWSPDGTKVYFNRRDDVVEQEIASGAERVIYAQGLRPAQLSPDGRYIFGTTGYDAATQSSRMMVVPVAGGQPRELFRVTAPTGFRPGPFAWTPDSRAVLAIKNCAASTIFAGARQLFLPVQGQQRNPANPLARLGDDGPVGGLIGTRERRSADRRGGAHRGSGDHGAGRTRTSQRRPDHRVASVAAPA